MKDEVINQFLKDKIFEIQQSRVDPDKNNRIVTMHLEPDLFIKMAYIVIGQLETKPKN